MASVVTCLPSEPLPLLLHGLRVSYKLRCYIDSERIMRLVVTDSWSEPQTRLLYDLGANH